MKKVLMLAVALMVAAAPAFAQDKKAAPAADKTMSAAGAVTAVTADSVTVKGKTGEWTFAVDGKTQVTASGASHKTARSEERRVGKECTSRSAPDTEKNKRRQTRMTTMTATSTA